MRTAKTDQTEWMPKLILSLHCAHKSFCWFGHGVAHLLLTNPFSTHSDLEVVCLQVFCFVLQHKSDILCILYCI